MDLTIEHLAAYLPYGLKFLPTHYNKDKKQDTLYYLSTMLEKSEFGINGYTSNYVKPILRPLSNLIKEIEHNGKKFVPIDIIYKLWNEKSLGQFSKSIILQKVQLYTNSMPHFIVEKLHSWHFDTKGLIESGLAINYNELNK